MAGFTTEKHGFETTKDVIVSAISDMLDNGFELVYGPGQGNTWDPETVGDAFNVTLEAGEDVDPTQALAVDMRQPWRVTFQVLNAEVVGIFVATPLQLKDNGSWAFEKNTSGGKTDIIGSVGDQVNAGNLTVSSAEGQPFHTRWARIGANDGFSYPMAYYLAISPRGFFLGLWEDAVTAETSNYFDWVLVQRPVHRDTGEVITSGKAPVWCVSGVADKYWQFVVRENDILRPGKRRPANKNTEDSEAILNSTNQVGLSEDGKYVVTFPSRLNTSRYRYPYELDMLAVTSADVVSQYVEVPLTVYEEENPRIYKALHSNGSANTGMRILVLQSGGGMDA